MWFYSVMVSHNVGSDSYFIVNCLEILIKVLSTCYCFFVLYFFTALFTPVLSIFCVALTPQRFGNAL